MPLQFQLIQAPLRFGLSEDTDPHQVPFGTMTTSENTRWVRTGRLEKRFGITSLGMGILGGGTISAASRLVVHGNELGLINGTNFYAYRTDGWIDRGRIPEVGLTWTTSHAAIAGTTSSDLALTSDDKLIEAWVAGDPSTVLSGSLYYRIIDRSTGVIITPPTLLDTGVISFIRVLASGTNWVILWTGLASGNLFCQTSAGNTTLDTGAANSTARPALDAYVQGTDFVVAYSLEAGGIRLGRYPFGATPVASATGSVTGESSKNISSIGIHGAAGETLYIGYADIVTNHRIRFAAANPSTLVQTVAPVNVSVPATLTSATVTLWRASSTTCKFVYQTTTSATVIRISTATISNAGSATSGSLIHGLMPLTKPFLIGSRFFMGVATRPQAYSTVDALSDTFLIDITSEPFRQVGKVDVYVGNYWPSVGYVAGVVGVSSTKYLTHYPFLTSVEVGKVDITSARLVEMTTGADRPSDMWRSVPVLTDVAIGAGMLTTYDGAEVVGYSWPYSSEVDGNTTISGVGGSIAAGDHIYNVTSERRSATGVLHRSPVGIDRTITTAGATSSVTVSILPVSLGAGQYSRGSHLIYRSVTNTGELVQRLAIPPSYMTIEETGGGAYPVTIVDTKDDTNIGSGGGGLELASRPFLYTAGGALEDVQPPSSITLATHQNRIFALLGDRRTIMLSKSTEDAPGVAPGFNPGAQFVFDTDQIAMCEMDDKLAVFSESAINVLVGAGPAPDGSKSTYEFVPVQTDVGCINPRSVVSMPDGIMFQSDRGIYLLSRSLQVVFAGKQVQDQTTAYPNITSALLVSKRGEIRFTANNAGGTAGITLAYNYLEKQWTTARYTIGGVYGAPIADATMWNGVWTIVTPSGQVCTESSTSYLDDTHWVPLTIETAWNNAAGPLAYQVVRNFALEGISNSDHDLTLSVGFDTETSYTDSRTFLAGSPVTSPGPFESCEISIGPRRKCQAIRFKIQDASPTGLSAGTGQGPGFDMLGIEVGVPGGFARKPTTKTG